MQEVLAVLAEHAATGLSEQIAVDIADCIPSPDERNGYVIVPQEPTDAMVEAGLAVTAAWHDLPGSAMTVNREKMRRRYRAMIDAAS